MNSRHSSSNPGRALSRIGMALALLMAGGAQAQSLQELYDAARAFDAQYLSARALADSAQYKAAQADALARPSLGLGVTAKRDETDPPNFSRVGATSLSAGLQGKYALYNRSNQLTISQAQLGLTVAQADLETAEQDLIVRVAQAYFDVLGAQDALGTARASKAMISEQLASAKRNFEVGTQTITDTREAQARYDLALATEIAAENDLRIKSVTLDQLVGRNGVTPKPLAVPVALPAVTPLTVDPWVAQAEEQHPLVRKARLGLDSAKIEIDKARAAEGVTLDLNGSLGTVNARGAGAQLKGTTHNASLGVTLSLPLYTGGATQNRIKETLALEQKSRNDLDYARRAVSEGTKRAFFGVQSLTAQVKALEAAESSSKLALEATQLGYKVGVRVNLDVLNAQTQLFNTQQNLAKARYDVVMTSLKLRQASGQLKPEDVSAVNQLLAK
ncbi:channel protein TolC [Paucibacter aquatile]|uniref:Channel protein TolC n=2 Tax=Sphaerotilaceae TaxID=2975441 RepID=A0A2N8KUM1_9BURK|nr:channel protein TolC [Paucibacter aquatile]